MDMELESGQEGLGGLNEPVEIVPPAVAGQLLLHIAPEALDEVELRGVSRQPEGLEPVSVLLPPSAQGNTLVVARIVEHQDRGFPCRQLLGKVLEEVQERGLAFLLTAVVQDPPTRIVEGTEDHKLAIFPGCRHLHGRAFLAPDFRQVRMGMDFAFVEIDQMESPGLSNCFFCNQSNTRRAVATASAFWRWVRSWRGRR